MANVTPYSCFHKDTESRNKKSSWISLFGHSHDPGICRPRAEAWHLRTYSTSNQRQTLTLTSTCAITCKIHPTSSSAGCRNGRSFLSPLPKMPSPSPEPEKTSHKVDVITVQLQFLRVSAGKSTGKKGPAAKLDTKNKELAFTFECTEANYLDFLSAILKEHGHSKYVPVKKQSRFGIKVGMGSKKTYVY